MNLQKLLMSSANPKEVSATIKGLAVALIPIIMLVTGATEAELNAIVDAVIAIVFYVSAIYSSVMTILGLIRKIRMRRWSAVK